MLSHLTAYNFHFQLNKIFAVLGWSSSSNLALLLYSAPFGKWKIKLELHTQLEVKAPAVHRN